MSESKENKSFNDLELVISAYDYSKIMHWVDKSTYEVSGFGKVEETDGIFVVSSVVLLEQENTMSNTEIDPKALSKAMFELRDKPGKFKFWWHSHVDMPVFWSSTDMAAIHSIGGNGWVIATVFNQNREHKSLYYQKRTDSFPEIQIDNIKTTIEEPSYNEVDIWDKEYAEKVKNKNSVISYSSIPAIMSHTRNFNPFSWQDLIEQDPTDDIPDYKHYSNISKSIEQKFLSPPKFGKIKNKKCKKNNK